MKKKLSVLAPVAAVALLYCGLSVLGVGCPIKFITGVSCAGCGMTRAWKSLIQLNFNTALTYHPLFFLPPVYLVLWLLRNKISEKLFKIFTVVFIACFIIVFIIRIYNPMDNIVTFNVNKGIIFKIFRRFF